MIPKSGITGEYSSLEHAMPMPPVDFSDDCEWDSDDAYFGFFVDKETKFAHNTKGPAKFWIREGSEYDHIEYYENGQCHRLDGPAVISASGKAHWYVSHVDVTEEVENWFSENHLSFETMSDEEKILFHMFISGFVK